MLIYIKNLTLIFALALACVTAPQMPESPKGPNGPKQPNER